MMMIMLMLFMIVKMMVMIMMMMMMMMMIQIHEVVDNRGNAITVMVTIMKVPMCFFLRPGFHGKSAQV